MKGISELMKGYMVEVSKVSENMKMEGKEIEFKVIKMDKKRKKVVVYSSEVIE